MVFVAEADQGVALVIEMPAVPRLDRRRYVAKRDRAEYGYIDVCQARTQLPAFRTMRRFLTTTDAEIALASP